MQQIPLPEIFYWIRGHSNFNIVQYTDIRMSADVNCTNVSIEMPRAL